MGGWPRYRWVYLASWIILAGVAAAIGASAPLGHLAGVMLVALGVGVVWRSGRVTATVTAEALVVRNRLGTTTVPSGSIATITAETVPYPNVLRSYGRLVVSDDAGTTTSLVGTTGATPHLIEQFVTALAEAAPEAVVRVDLSLFPHDRSKLRGERHLGSAPVVVVAPPPTTPEEQQRRRREAGRADADRLRDELARIEASKRS